MAEQVLRWKCTQCGNAEFLTEESAAACEAACRAKREAGLAEEAIENGTIAETRDTLDHEELCAGVPAQPLAGPAACIEDRIALMLGVLHGSFGSKTEAIVAGQEALILCRKLALLESTEPSRLASDTVRAHDLIAKVGTP